MAGGTLDNAGIQKLKTLDEALVALQSIHGHVERMAIEVKNQRGTGVIPQQIKRAAIPLQGQLKPQFGMIADLISALVLAAGRGGSEQIKVRTLRESVGQIRQALEVTATRVREQHTVDDARNDEEPPA